MVDRGVGLTGPTGTDGLAGGGLAEAIALVDRLRSPGGCAWTAEQTHASLAHYAVEEAYEVVEAVQTGDRAALREELGDLLHQVLVHARLAQEHPDDPFDIDDVAAELAAKLVRRHPHVFAGDGSATTEQIRVAWQAVKAAEKGRASVLDGLPAAQPAMARASQALSRARAAGFGAVPVAGAGTEPQVGAAGVGAAILDLLRRAELTGVDAEAELREALRGYEAAVREAESLAAGGTVAGPVT